MVGKRFAVRVMNLNPIYTVALVTVRNRNGVCMDIICGKAHMVFNKKMGEYVTSVRISELDDNGIPVDETETYLYKIDYGKQINNKWRQW